ncbi:MAG: hypothetical protein QXO15_12305 [Nitrososphaerota archaeon]
MFQPKPEFCRNCLNFIERRDVEGFAACARNHRPRIACQDFKPKEDSPIFTKEYGGFCLYCENLTLINGFATCARNHRPRIACQDFKDGFLNLRKLCSVKRVKIADRLS